MAPSTAELIGRLRDRIQDSEEISDVDQEVLLEFDDQLTLRGAEYSDHRHLKLLRHNVIAAEEVGGLSEALDDRNAAEDVVKWINRTYENPETNRDYRVAFRMFGRLTTDGDEPPESIEWVPSGTPSTYDPAPDPGEMLSWEEDVQPMVEATSRPKEAAAVAVQFDAGFRGGEFKQLSVDQFTDHRFGLQATVQGKQGQRTVTLIPSVPHIRKWLEAHPGGDEAPLWSKETAPETRVSDRTIYNWFERAADRAEISKPITLTNFRKSSASFMASRGMSQAHLEERYGWVRGSKTASRYVQIFAEQSEIETAKAWGKEIEEDEEPEAMDPLECQRCGRETPRSRDMCVWCGQALEPGAAEVAEELEAEILDSIRDAPSDEKLQNRVDLLERFRESPERRAELVDEFAQEI